MGTVELYDATLRDGMGGVGMSLTAAEKLRVVERLDELGVDLIEAGFPASNPKERELFTLLERARLRHARIVAFGMTRRRGAKAVDDEGLGVLARSFAPVCTLVGKSSTLQVQKVLRVSLRENLAMIAESVAFLVEAGKRVLFDAEHFFDGYRLDPDYALESLRAAHRAGAQRAVLCDTNGGTLPGEVGRIVAAVRAELPELPLGIHTHNDSGCAVANALVAVEAGATQVQGTVNGIGERTGNANLITIIADLQLKMGFKLLSASRLARLTETAHYIDELLNRAPDPKQPYVGRHAFAHKAGLHASGVRSDPGTFEHVDPASVGNARELVVSELSGRATVLARAAQAGIELPERAAAHAAEEVKVLEHAGYQFEAADGSFELLLRRRSGHYQPLFRLESWRVIVEKRAQAGAQTEATIKIWVPGKEGERRYIQTAEGNGPVNALDNALRAAIDAVHPQLRDIELVNYKVRILDESKGTGAVTRVLIDASDGRRVWGTIGVSENLISASWDALVDSLEYGMVVAEAGRARGGRNSSPRRRPNAGAPADGAAPSERGKRGRSALRTRAG
jgi:2-isopropylmalate synthase